MTGQPFTLTVTATIPFTAATIWPGGEDPAPPANAVAATVAAALPTQAELTGALLLNLLDHITTVTITDADGNTADIAFKDLPRR
ncbi:hypothetical protein [Kitasatospora sp. NPDC015120]|uniref:hypothetical protein n=1 Tax=Kitasatospora sp. NPDC015120 TaxID=3364023 RepID=UPI0036F48904